MSVAFAPGWLADVRTTKWYNNFAKKDPTTETISDGTVRWTYSDADGNALYANRADEILAVNAPFLQSFSENPVWSALGVYAMDHLADDDANGAHCRAIVSEDTGDVLTVEQGMHQPESDDDESGGFYLHVTIRLTATTNAADAASVNQPRHAYMMQNNDGSLYVTDMT